MTSMTLFKNRKSVIFQFIALIGVMLLMSCGGGNTSNTERLEKMDRISSLIESRKFKIENEWALPLGGNRINLIGNPNFISFKGDSVKLFLPYFGVRHSGSGYGDSGGIEYEGLTKDLNISKVDGKKIILKFGADQKSENLDFLITLFSNGNASTSVNSSQRQTISYQGTIKPIVDKK